MQWHALAVVLSELSEQPLTRDTERAWRVIEETGPEWEIPEDKAGRILYQSIKKLLAKAQAHRASQAQSQSQSQTLQNISAQCESIQMNRQNQLDDLDIKPLIAVTENEHEPLYPTQPFDPMVFSHGFHAPPNFPSLPVQNHGHPPQGYYVSLHHQLSAEEINQQQQDQHNQQQPQHMQPQQWYFDPNVQPLQDQDLVFNAEYWSGWDPVKDYSMHGGPV